MGRISPAPSQVSSLSEQTCCGLAWRMGGESQPGFAGRQPHNPTAGTEKKTQQATGADQGRPWYLVILHSVGKGQTAAAVVKR